MTETAARRPWSIVDFERIMFGTIALGAIKTWLDWDLLMTLGENLGESNPRTSALFTLAFTMVLLGGLTLLVSRRRSRIAMWFSIAMFALGLPAMIAIFAHGVPMGSWFLTVMQTVGQLAAYGLLFTPSARHWLKNGPEVSVEIFR